MQQFIYPQPLRLPCLFMIKTTMRRKTVFALACLILLVTSGINAQNFDTRLLKSIDERETDFKNNLFKPIAQSVTIFNLVTPVVLLTAGIVNHDKKLKKDAVFMAGGFILSTVVTHSLKKIIKRDRPFVNHPLSVKRDAGGGYSFPSGHTSAAFCTATSLCLIYPKWYVIAPAYLYAAAVGYARIYQGVHYPSDVLAGAVVGAGSAWLAFKAEKWISKKNAGKKMHNFALL